MQSHLLQAHQTHKMLLYRFCALSQCALRPDTLRLCLLLLGTSAPALSFAPPQSDPPPPEVARDAQEIASSDPVRLSDLHLREPAWKSPVVHHESSVLLQEPQGLPQARLAFRAAEILKVRSAKGFAQYQEGVHWKLDESRTILEWTGPLPCEPIPTDQIFLPATAPHSYKHRLGNPDQNLLYRPGNWFHERNIEVTYRREQAPEASESVKTQQGFSRTLKKLREHSKVIIGISGDSISTGLDASATTGTEPKQPGYPELIVSQLKEDFGATIELINRSVAGWSIANGLEDLDKLLESKPDLLIVAYGMNDVGRRDPAWFADQVRKIQSQAKQSLPDIEILWVTPMLGNREWIHTPRAMFNSYREALQKAIEPSADRIADLTEVWEILLQKKHDLDLTGNGLNHPNDYGHRLYAQAILELLEK